MTLEPGLIARLQARYPTLNVHEIAIGCDTADNPSAVLVARCKAAGKAAVSHSRKDQEKPEHWTSSGTWTSHGQRDLRLSDFLRELWRRRHDPILSPRGVAMSAEVASVQLAFPSREHWLEPPHDDCPALDWWHSLRCATGAEEWVKRCFIASFGPDRSLPIDPIEASRLVAESTARLLAGKGAAA